MIRNHMNHSVLDFECHTWGTAEIADSPPLFPILLSYRRTTLAQMIAMLPSFFKIFKSTAAFFRNAMNDLAVRKMNDLSVGVCTIDYRAHFSFLSYLCLSVFGYSLTFTLYKKFPRLQNCIIRAAGNENESIKSLAVYNRKTNSFRKVLRHTIVRNICNSTVFSDIVKRSQVRKADQLGNTVRSRSELQKWNAAKSLNHHSSLYLIHRLILWNPCLLQGNH